MAKRHKCSNLREKIGKAKGKRARGKALAKYMQCRKGKKGKRGRKKSR